MNLRTAVKSLRSYFAPLLAQAGLRCRRCNGSIDWRKTNRYSVTSTSRGSKRLARSARTITGTAIRCR